MGEMFWKLLGGTIMMLAFGYMGEIGAFGAWPAFGFGLMGWFFILYEIFAGEAGGTASGCSEAVLSSFTSMRIIVSLGWCIYPLGYLFGYLLGKVDDKILNVVYNIADFVNKIAFVLACWSAAKSDSHLAAAQDKVTSAANLERMKAMGVPASVLKVAREEHNKI